MAEKKSKGWINLEKAEVLLLDDQDFGLNVLVQIVTAFGVRHFHRCTSIDEARDIAHHRELHLIIANANLRTSCAYDFVAWLRRSGLQPNAFAPAVLISGHSQLSDVRKARDCGCNYVMAKPVSPDELLKRILWIARERRPFVACADYTGPDRRVSDTGPPAGIPGRRATDKAPAGTWPADTNSQSEAAA